MSRYYIRRLDPKYSFSRLMCKLLSTGSGTELLTTEVYTMKHSKRNVWISKNWITESC